MYRFFSFVLLTILGSVAFAGDLTGVATDKLLEELETRVGQKASSAKVYYYCDETLYNNKKVTVLRMNVINEFGNKQTAELYVSQLENYPDFCKSQVTVLKENRTDITKFTEFALCLYSNNKDTKNNINLFTYVVAPTPALTFAERREVFTDEKACLDAALTFNTK